MHIHFVLEGKHEYLFVELLYFHGVDRFPSFEGDVFDVSKAYVFGCDKLGEQGKLRGAVGILVWKELDPGVFTGYSLCSGYEVGDLHV